MIFDGEWKVTKYKITRTVITYDDRPELYPDSTAEAITLTPTQTARLDEIRYTPMAQADAIAYVFDGLGTAPDTRTEVDRLIDMIPTLTSDILSAVPVWEKDQAYSKGHYLRDGNAVYKVTTPHKSETPPEVGTDYEKVMEVTS